MNFFKPNSIRKKLTAIIMLVSSTALVVACLTFMIYDYLTFRNEMVQNLETLADVIGNNTTAALNFRNQEDAREILTALMADEHIMFACILDETGLLFSDYLRAKVDPSKMMHPIIHGNKYEFKSDRLGVSRKIVQGNEKLGSVYIESDLGALNARLRTYAVILFVVLTLSSFVAFIMTFQLQKFISKPILHLAKMAKRVSVKKDYSLRASKQSNDELGFLTERFNEMLAQIQDRDSALLKAHSTLKKQAKELQVELKERKRLQEELARAQRLESVGRIAGQIAHDFNNLLGPLAAYPSMIREDLPVNHPVLEMVDEMEASANKIAQINQQLLALGRRGHYRMEPVNLHELIQQVVLARCMPPEIQVNEALAANHAMLKGGAAQLTRALINIIMNSMEAISSEGIIKIITGNIFLDMPLKGYETVNPGEYIKLQISDTGAGIMPEIVDKIFDPFFTTKTMDRMRGSGLGLSVVHGIVEDHNGYVTVESEVGKGASFFLYFPVSRELQNASVAEVEVATGGEEEILVVDDDPIQRRVTRSILDRLGYEVHTISSGEQAIEYLKIHDPDLLLLDMMMDGIDGTETYRQILEFKPDQKAIVLSGYAMSKRVEEAIGLGAGGFISKPVSLNSLATAVRKELDENSE